MPGRGGKILHWGRTYESYSSDPKSVSVNGAALVEGLQGKVNTSDYLSSSHVLATAKHFLGDGGTLHGTDEGDTQVSETVLRDVHARGYYATLAAGVQTVMVSYSSWNGAKMHGNTALLTGLLKQRMGFDGFVIGDWNGHAQIPGCKPDDCAAAFNAGVDMFMAPDHWRGLYDHTLAEVKHGVISRARLDDAVRRILRVKFRAGVFAEPKPSARPDAGRIELLASPPHRALAREAVHKSLVLLKNDKVLPLAGRLHVLVAGDSADSIPRQSGGWTISWQGTGTNNADFPQAQSIFVGIRNAAAATGGSADLSPDGNYTIRPDVAIVVFGEPPYAEMKGDRPSQQFGPSLVFEGGSQLAILKRLQAAGIPTISVFISGRPLDASAEIDASTAFVAAWLPGTEGGGVADLLFRPMAGQQPAFTGRLPFPWPVSHADGAGDLTSLPVGYGLSYGPTNVSLPKSQ